MTLSRGILYETLCPRCRGPLHHLYKLIPSFRREHKLRRFRCSSCQTALVLAYIAQDESGFPSIYSDVVVQNPKMNSPV